ncbi:MAG: tRNA dihydrouridine synthase DusB [Cellvibrionales bacterium]|nr:tRNA dihydrouridine synthase DusB [Cellvibrionales bacterium]
MISLGPHKLQSRVLLAPMAGVSDFPMRTLCQGYGAGLTTTEMITSKTHLWETDKSSFRFKKTRYNHIPHSIQIVGSDPKQLAFSAQMAVEAGADIIDINMGCPAKKVCKKLAGSALLGDEQLVGDILTAVVGAVSVPVTLKIRTGTEPSKRNATTIGKIAEDAGIQMLTIHGRTRACRFLGQAEYDTIADVVQSVKIPVIANGDIKDPTLARKVLDYTKAAGIMVGRGVQGQPWLIKSLVSETQNRAFNEPTFDEKILIIQKHMSFLYQFYGDQKGVQIARKHMTWYLENLTLNRHHKQAFNTLASINEQKSFIQDLAIFFKEGNVA